MNCKKAMELSAEYLSVGLQESEKAGLMEHLAGCALCRGEMELLENSWRALDAYKAPEPGDDFTDSVMRNIRAGQAQEQNSVFSSNHFGFLSGARAAMAGWWKVPAITLASCAVYVLCIENGLLPQRRADFETDGGISAIFADSPGAGGGNLLIMMEGVDK